jgi:ABC-type branched-subunit amino acid transport system substrate-binding protein
MVRHPRRVVLEAWFDGEIDDGIGAHVGACGRCQQRLLAVQRVGAAVRATPFAAPTPRLRVPHVAVAGLAAAMVTLLLFRLPDAGVQVGILGSHNSDHATHGSSRVSATGASGLARSGSNSDGIGVGRLAPRLPASGTGDQGASPMPPPAASWALPLRLGVVVPSLAPRSGETGDIERAVDVVARAANAAGGINGRPVDIVALDGAQPLRPGRVDVLVGGFGIAPPAGTPWLLPADPTVAGADVMSAELTPTAAGTELAMDLARRGIQGTIAVLIGSGPESGMAQGVAAVARTYPLKLAPTSSCDQEVGRLRFSGAVALAIAASPDQIVRCADAVARVAWSPPGGLLVPPSVAYERTDLVPELLGARTVLGLPWPTSPDAGAARFRAAVGSSSYRALVSFAAAELAIQVARAKSVITPDTISSQSWKTDLTRFDGMSNTGARVDVAGPGGWFPTGDRPPGA